MKSEPAPHNQPNQSRRPAILISGGHQRQLNISYESTYKQWRHTKRRRKNLCCSLPTLPTTHRRAAGNLGQLQNGFKNGRRGRKKRTAIVPKSNRAVARPACRNIDVDALYKNPTVGRRRFLSLSRTHTRPRGVVSNGSAGNRMTIIPTQALAQIPCNPFLFAEADRPVHGQILQRPFVLIYGGFGETRIAAAAAASGTKCCERERVLFY